MWQMGEQDALRKFLNHTARQLRLWNSTMKEMGFLFSLLGFMEAGENITDQRL